MRALKILVVDDSPTNARLLAAILEKQGHRVVAFAANGHEAIEAYRLTAPDLVTMDILMPDMDGIDATRAIITLDPSARIVMVTSQRRQTMVAKALAAGARGYVTLPLDKDEIADVLRMIERYHATIVRGVLTWAEDDPKAAVDLPMAGLGFRPLRALVADDSPITRELLANMLKQLGHQVVGTAGTGAEAVASFRALDPDLVTMDIVMPGMDGIEATRRIVEYFPRALIVMVTSLGQETMLVKALAAGARGYVTQPIDKSRLNEVIEMARRYRVRLVNGNLTWIRR